MCRTSRSGGAPGSGAGATGSAGTAGSTVSLMRTLLDGRRLGWRAGRSSGLLGLAADVVVAGDGEQEDHAEEQVPPVAVPAGERDALRRHRHDERADGAAGRRAVAAREQVAADDRGD